MVSRLGQKADFKLRQVTRRIDGRQQRSLIDKARTFIYKRRKGVTGKWVEELLYPKSFVPTKVRFIKLEISAWLFRLTTCSPECLLGQAARLRIQLLPNALQRPATRVRDWRVEGRDCPFDSDSAHRRGRYGQRNGRKVR